MLPRGLYRTTNLGGERENRVPRSSVVHPELEDAVRVRDCEGFLEQPLRPRLEGDPLVRVQHHELHLRTSNRNIIGIVVMIFVVIAVCL